MNTSSESILETVFPVALVEWVSAILREVNSVEVEQSPFFVV